MLAITGDFGVNLLPEYPYLRAEWPSRNILRYASSAIRREVKAGDTCSRNLYKAKDLT